MRIDLLFKDRDTGCKVINECNRRMVCGIEMYFGVEEMIDELRQVTECRTFVNGKEIYGYYTGFSNYGWNVNDGLIEVTDIVMCEEDGELWYSVSPPVRDYYKLW